MCGRWIMVACGAITVLVGVNYGKADEQLTVSTESRGTGDPSDRYALLVGIDDYPGERADFKSRPLGDVTVMADLLVESYGFTEENILVLEDERASRDNITRAFLAHLGQAGPDGVAVFFFSGHGYRLPENIHVMDSEANGVDESLVVWGAEQSTTFILDDELGHLLDELQAERTLVIIDACFSGTATMGGGVLEAKEARESDMINVLYPKRFVGEDRDFSEEPVDGEEWPFLDRLERADRHVLIAAASEEELAWTGYRAPDRTEKVSLFTHFLGLAVTELGPTATFQEVLERVSMSVADVLYLNDKPVQTPQLVSTNTSQSIGSYLARR